MERLRFIPREMNGRTEEVALIGGATVMGGQFRNFSGEKKGPRDQPGVRYFNIELKNPVIAQDLADHNYPVNIKQRADGSMIGYLRVRVKPEDKYHVCIVKVKVGNNETVLQPDEYAILDGDTRGTDYEGTLITSANLTLRIWEYDTACFTCQLEEGIFNLQPISYWDSRYAEEENPHE